MYVCGITPYDVTHLGHAATFVWADAVVSVLRSVGVHTVSCRNVTDVDDVLTSAAVAHGRHYDDYAVYQEFLFEQDMAALRVARRAYAPRARHFIPQVLQLAAALLATGNAYEREGSVFFRGIGGVAASGLSRDRAAGLAREFGDNPDDPMREDPFDVPVWRPSTARDPAWPSPWGWGRPGWHAECAAMAMAAFGASVDLLIGGQDLTFPHHAYQSAMVQAATSGPYVDIEMYGGPGGDPLAYKDAVFLSPHKFIGGPSTPGVLAARRELLRNRVPDVPGGGTVAYVTRPSTVISMTRCSGRRAAPRPSSNRCAPVWCSSSNKRSVWR